MDSATQTYQRSSGKTIVERLILDNVDYVKKILSTITAGLPPNYDKENLEQAGIVGLVETANSFDPTKGVAFRTYAFPRIRGAIIDEMRKNSPVPQKMLESIREVNAAYEKLESPVTPEMLADYLGVSVRKIQKILEAMRFLKPQQLNDLFGVIHGSWRSEIERPDSELELREKKKVVADCIERLPDRERLVLTLYFSEDLTLAEIGEVLGISESRVSRNLASAKFRLKELVLAFLG